MAAYDAPRACVLSVYALCEPTAEFLPRYIGITNDVRRRVVQHRNSAVPNVKQWIDSLGCDPRVVVIDLIDVSFRWSPIGFDRERWWIQHLVAQGHQLLNEHGRDDIKLAAIERASARVIKRRVRRQWTAQHHSCK